MTTLKHYVFTLAERFVQVVEICLALGLIFLVVGGMVFGGEHLWSSVTTWTGQSFQTFIDQALLYIIGLEVAMMLIKHDPNLVLDILIFAIARKMIVEISGGLDFFLGSLAILILYIVRHYDLTGLRWLGRKGDQAATQATDSQSSCGEYPPKHYTTPDGPSIGSP